MEKLLIENLENNTEDKIAVVNKIIKFSNVDGPGNRIAIFFQGCNIDCAYCHNPETISIGSNEYTKNYSVTSLLEEVEKVKHFIKGVTVSGGECSLQYQFISDFFKNIKLKYPNLTCFVDTNGTLDLSKDLFRDFIKYTDYFMLDVKAWKSDDHIKLTGINNDNILKNLLFLKNSNKLFEVRTVIVPGVLDNETTVEKVSEIISDTEINYKLIKYRSIGVRETKLVGINSPTTQYMENLKKLSLSFGIKNVVII
ncbi:MAG: radical SAM protein [Cetobacterium sp.]